MKNLNNRLFSQFTENVLDKTSIRSVVAGATDVNADNNSHTDSRTSDCASCDVEVVTDLYWDSNPIR